jgi:hypothetical protein
MTATPAYQFSKEILGDKINTIGSSFTLSKEICMKPDTIEDKGITAHCFNQLMLIPLVNSQTYEGRARVHIRINE